ncbi:TIM barrel protein [Candidatus Micrarchaeota archaeon]|nr:TIM barrel protein [Candidatus Micrarchaeota archaeon]
MEKEEKTGKLLFGTAGVPHSAKGTDSVSGVNAVRELGLDAMELEFVHGVRMSAETARAVRTAAEENNVMLSVHAPYYINLNSKEKDKIEASKKRIFESARIGALAGAKKVTFHPAFYQGMDREKTMDNVVNAMEEILAELGKEKIKITLAPETTGKGSQFGSLEETLELCSRVRGVEPMIDFSHLHARGNGALKTAGDFEAVLEKIGGENKKFLNNLQMHVSGINYGEKGERNHLNLEDSDFRYKLLIGALTKFDVSGIVICESPNIEGDALLMQKYYSSQK